RDVVNVLIIDEFEIAQELKTSETAVKKEASNGKAAAPAIERVTRGHGGEQSDPNQAGNKIDIRLQQQRVEKIDPGRITKMVASGVNWIGWPKPDAVGEKVDVGEVKS